MPPGPPQGLPRLEGLDIHPAVSGEFQHLDASCDISYRSPPATFKSEKQPPKESPVMVYIDIDLHGLGGSSFGKKTMMIQTAGGYSNSSCPPGCFTFPGQTSPVAMLSWSSLQELEPKRSGL